MQVKLQLWLSTRMQPYSKEVQFFVSLYQRARVRFGKMKLEKETGQIMKTFDQRAMLRILVSILRAIGHLWSVHV